MGFEVQAYEDILSSGKGCFTGVSSSIKNGHLKRKPSADDKNTISETMEQTLKLLKKAFVKLFSLVYSNHYF